MKIRPCIFYIKENDMEEWVQARYLTTKSEVLVLADYEVSNYGRFRNKKTNKILNVYHTKYGYCFVRPCIKDEWKTCFLHRLVLSSFTDNVDGSLEVNHKDENTENNCLNNLEWMSHLENIEYSQAKLVLQYDKSGAFIREWSSMSEVERQLGIAQNNISKCCNGKLKSAGGFVWRYKE